MLSCSLLLAAYECGNTSAAAVYDDVSLTTALYHPGSYGGLFALCLCLSVCFCVLAITTQVQMLRASLSETSGSKFHSTSCCVYSLMRVDLDCGYLHTPCIYTCIYMLYYTLGPFEALRSWNIGNNNNKLRSRRGRLPLGLVF